MLSSFLLMVPVSNISTVSAVIPDYWPTEEWRTSTPEDQGMNSTLLQEMEGWIQRRTWGDDVISLLIVHNGYLVYENYFGDPDRINQANEIHSCTKSVTSALVGIALAQGLIGSIQDYILDYFPDRTFDNMDERKEAITIEHLLSMKSGLPWDESSYPWGHPLNDYSAIVNSSDWLQWMLDRPMQYSPGEEYVYNTGGSHVLSALVSEVSGMNTSVFADQYLFTPLGINNFWWPGDPQGHAMGGSDLYLIPRYMAKFGYLYLRGGIWDGQVIVPPSWVATSTTTNYIFQSINPESIGYAHQWWTYDYLDAFLARGYLGQYIWVIPSHDLVVVITGNSNDIDEVTPVEHFIIPATPLAPPPFSPPLILLPIGIGISIVAILIVVYWKRRPR